MTELDFLEQIGAAVDGALERLLPAADVAPERLHAAMRYSSFAGGKRVRPALVVLAGEVWGGDRDALLEPAAALEMIHCFSLIHDDLPALDDDDLRRGRPSLHRRYDEATAILAGDALLNLAFEVLASHPADCPAERRLANVRCVAAAVGTGGMIGGQMADLEAEGAADPAAADAAQLLESIHRRKTGALLQASLEVGGRCTGADEPTLERLRELGAAIGLIFQIRDDILDIEGDAGTLGKTAGKDAAADKLTYPAVHGLDRSRELLRAEALRSAHLLSAFADGAARTSLSCLLDFLLRRDH